MHGRKASLVFVMMLAAIPHLLSGASAQILATPNMEHVCKTAPPVTHRRTLVYVDLASITKGKTEWGLTILNRLELAPREWLTILSVNPNTFEINQVFDLCFPSLTKSEIDQQRRERGLWNKLTNLDPEDQQRENLQTFDARLRNSLDRLISEAAKLQQGKRRNVVGAIAFDKNRFADRTAVYRIIIYTNGTLIDPELESPADSPARSAALVAKYPANFFGAEVFVFGVSETGDSPGSLQSNERVLSAFFLANWAHVKSFSSSLPQQRNDLFPAVVRWDGSFEGGGTQGATRLAFSHPKGNEVAEIWIGFVLSRLQLFVPFEGAIECEGDRCRMAATCTETVPLLSAAPYFRKGDRLTLQGKKDVDFEGSLIAETREVFNGGNQEVRYGMKFKRP
jgi:hypothetical protein